MNNHQDSYKFNTESMILIFGEEGLQVTEKNKPTDTNMVFKGCASRPRINGVVCIWISML